MPEVNDDQTPEPPLLKSPFIDETVPAVTTSRTTGGPRQPHRPQQLRQPLRALSAPSAPSAPDGTGQLAMSEASPCMDVTSITGKCNDCDIHTPPPRAGLAAGRWRPIAPPLAPTWSRITFDARHRRVASSRMRGLPARRSVSLSRLPAVSDLVSQIDAAEEEQATAYRSAVRVPGRPSASSRVAGPVADHGRPREADRCRA